MKTDIKELIRRQEDYIKGLKETFREREGKLFNLQDMIKTEQDGLRMLKELERREYKIRTKDFGETEEEKNEDNNEEIEEDNDDEEDNEERKEEVKEEKRKCPYGNCDGIAIKAKDSEWFVCLKCGKESKDIKENSEEK